MIGAMPRQAKPLKDASRACMLLIAPEFRPKRARDTVLYHDAETALQALFPRRPKDHREAKRMYHDAIDQVGRAIVDEIRQEMRARNEHLGPKVAKAAPKKAAAPKRAKRTRPEMSFTADQVLSGELD